MASNVTLTHFGINANLATRGAIGFVGTNHPKPWGLASIPHLMLRRWLALNHCRYRATRAAGLQGGGF